MIPFRIGYNLFLGLLFDCKTLCKRLKVLMAGNSAECPFILRAKFLKLWLESDIFEEKMQQKSVLMTVLSANCLKTHKLKSKFSWFDVASRAPNEEKVEESISCNENASCNAYHRSGKVARPCIYETYLLNLAWHYLLSLTWIDQPELQTLDLMIGGQN